LRDQLMRLEARSAALAHAADALTPWAISRMRPAKSS